MQYGASRSDEAILHWKETSHVRSLAPSLTFAAIACYYPSMSDLKAARYASGESTCNRPHVYGFLFKCINLEIETMV